MSWRRHLALLVLLALPCGAALLYPFPRLDLYPLGGSVNNHGWSNLGLNGLLLDNSLLLSNPRDHAVVMEGMPGPGGAAVHTSIKLRRLAGYSGRVSLARRDSQRIVFLFDAKRAGQNGVFLQGQGDLRLLQDMGAITRPASEAAVVRLEAILGPGNLSVTMNGRGATADLPGKGWRPDLEITALHQPSTLMLDELAVSSVTSDGAARPLISVSFRTARVVGDLGPILDGAVGRQAARVCVLALLLLTAALLDLALLWLHRRARLGRFLGLGPCGLLALTWPALVGLLLLLRGTLRLHFSALAACLLITLLARYLALAAEGLRAPGKGLRGVSVPGCSTCRDSACAVGCGC